MSERDPNKPRRKLSSQEIKTKRHEFNKAALGHLAVSAVLVLASIGFSVKGAEVNRIASEMADSPTTLNVIKEQSKEACIMELYMLEQGIDSDEDDGSDMDRSDYLDDLMKPEFKTVADCQDYEAIQEVRRYRGIGGSGRIMSWAFLLFGIVFTGFAADQWNEGRKLGKKNAKENDKPDDNNGPTTPKP